MNTDVRLARLEKHNRLLKAGFALVAVVAVLPWIMGSQAEVNDSVRARQFAIVDKDGHTRGIWAIDDKDQCKLIVTGSGDKNHHAVTIWSGGDFATVEVASGGRAEAMITTAVDGGATVASREFMLWDEKHDHRGSMYTSNGIATLRLVGDPDNEDTCPTAMLAANKTTSRVFAKDGQVIVSKNGKNVFVAPEK